MQAIDSNIWAYALDSTVPEHPRAARAVGKALEGDILINTAIQMEVAHYLVKRLGAVAGEETTDDFLALPLTVDALDPGLVRDSLRVLVRHTDMGIGGRDATLLASMQRHRVVRLLTHDATFRRVDWVEVVDPIE